MRPRIFWTLLASFALVIVLGICGMLGFIGLALSGVWEPAPFREVVSNTQRAYGEILGDYYVANGRSWQGVEQRLDMPPFSAGPAFGRQHHVIVDSTGRVVGGDDATFGLGTQVPQRLVQRGLPVVVNGNTVGILVSQGNAGPGRANGAPLAFVLPVARSFLLAGGGLALGLLLIAVLLSRWLARPLRNVTGAALRVAGGQLDVRVAGARIRELDELAQAFNVMSSSLAQADQQRRQMTADIAHELRTPLSIVKGRLEGLQDGVYQATPDQIALLLDEAALLERLIEDLRVLALAEAGQLPLYTEPTDSAELIETVAASFADQAAAQQVQLRTSAAEHMPLVEVDPQRMQQVLANIVANAMRYTPPGGTIVLSAAVNGASVELSVSDTGAGIAPADLPHVFDRFWRADRSRTRSSGGSGLGLAIAKQIVLAHHGDVQVESMLDRGTTVRITLPTVAATSERSGVGTSAYYK